MAIVINADDFGISHEVNLAICEAFKKGLITRTTLMVNMPFAKEAMEMAEREGFIDRVGLHLNLTAGKPLCKELSSDSIMCGKAGEFTADFARNIRTRFFLPKATSKLVEKEIKMQLDKYKELGGKLWHVDSHHHVHTDPSIWKAFCRAVKGNDCYPVASVRLGRNMYRGGNPLMRIYKSIFNSSVNSLCNTKRDYFGSMEDFENFFGSDFSAECCVGNKGGFDIEIMVHPMYSKDGELKDSDNILKKVGNIV